MNKRKRVGFKRILAGILTFLLCVTTVSSAMPAVVVKAARTFNHPGMLHTTMALEKIRQNVNNKVQPNLDTWNALLSDGYSKTTEAPRPLETVVRGGDGSNYAQFYKDIRRAYQLALVWSINGSEEHGKQACNFLNSWSSTMTTLTGNADRFLAAGIYGYELANAAELMRDHPDFDKDAMEELLVNVFYPMNSNFLQNHNDAHFGNYWANWDLCTIAGMMSIGIFADREDIYNEALYYYKNGIGMGSIYNTMPFVFDDGTAQWQEAGRDQGHTTLGVSLCSVICEMAWNQGDDLYSLSDNRLLKAAEYVVRYNSGYDDLQYVNYERHAGQSGNTEWYSVLSNAGRGSVRPAYSMVYNHYVNRMGLSAPNLKEALEPVEGEYTLELSSGVGDELGWQTLTFANLSGRAEKKAIQGPFEDGIYRITSVLTGKSLVVNGEGNLASAAKDTKEEEWWKFENLGDGEYIITNTVTNQVMQINGEYYTRGALVGTAERSNSLNQKFAFLEDGTGIYRIVSSASTHVVDLLNGGTADDTDVIQWQYLRGTGQKWTVERNALESAYAALSDKIAEAKTITIGNYELDSYISLQTVIEEAEAMVAEKTAQESDVLQKIEQIAQAADALQQATNMITLSEVKVTLSNKNEGNNAQEAGIAAIFDGDINTFVDVRNVTEQGTSGAGGYIIFDMGQDRALTLDKVAMVGGNGQYYTRIAGTVVEGSDNGTEWTTLTDAAVKKYGWQKVAVTDNSTGYRYIRVYNAGNWYGNIAELRVYGTLSLSGEALAAYESLENKITEAKAFVIDNYEIGSYISLYTVLAEAEVMLEEKTATTATVLEKVQQLTQAISGLQQVNNAIDLSSVAVTLSNQNSGANAQEAGIGAMFDRNIDTCTDVRNVTETGTSGWGGYMVFDMGEGKEIALDKVAMAARNDRYSTRLAGTVLQGSVNGAEWTTITEAATGNLGWQEVAVTEKGATYRYLRVFNANNWFGNIAELCVYGTIELSSTAYDSLETKISEAKAIMLGNYDIDSYISLQTVIGEAEVMLEEKTASRSVVLEKVSQLSETVSGLKQATNLFDLANVKATCSNYNEGTNAQEAKIGSLFDGDIGTFIDVRNSVEGTNGKGGYIVFDLGEGKALTLDKVAMAAREDQVGRLKGAVIQGSNTNDGLDWTTITADAVGKLGWQNVAVTDNVNAYRYLKLYNWNNWYGNIAELRVYGTLVISNTPAPTSKPTATPSPTSKPTATPSPTSKPTATPAPTSKPTATPAPTSKPTAVPTSQPTAVPTSQPTAAPTSQPTAAPTGEPTTAPTSRPTAPPTNQPPATPTSQPTTAPVVDGWQVENGKEYWYEDGVLQGTEGRGKEIYDPISNAWYWLDSELGGAVAKNKDVYQESEAGPWADRADGTGKWVRYDENGYMIKGWQNTELGKYYFDQTYGTMAKGYATIEGTEYYFDEATGLLVSEIGEVPTDGWKVMDGKSYWYESSVRQGFKVDDTYRGKEIYDAESDGWYWLDNVQGGAKAVSKDVYQESYSAYPDREDGTGKWVRYDENGRMIKGWQYTDAGTYYFEEVTGSMAKGRVTINGQEYYFNEATGVLQ